MVLLHTCEHVVPDKHDHIVVLQQKHYRVLVGNHQRGYRGPCISLALKKELLFLEEISQWLGVLGNTYGVEVINLPNHRIHSHMHN